ncbi:hypothetical protein K2173_021103 [Erythroxylum novogranatense]|uniref:SGF29 C-terminal domain-containing protein n=1 Tax=Erythroxylum novogranatense TaxID=1862640 RepID=A0AAV8TN07_9ROSI|nr:hypothetical protein K2173_021103 [Erythroxylum novogranatense]
MSAPDFEGISRNSSKLDQLRKQQEQVLVEINKMHIKLQAAPEIAENPGDDSLSQLKTLYIKAKDLSESEVNVSNALLSQLDVLLTSGPSGQRRKIGNDQKKKRMKADSDISNLNASARSQLEACASLKGEQVAARVRADNAENDEWFVVKVMNFDRETKEFEVLDEEPGDDEDGSGQKKYKLPSSSIIPFPKRNNPSSISDFVVGKHVLAVYPGTTTLYKATVVGPPRRVLLSSHHAVL